jgi:hypothetical protein
MSRIIDFLDSLPIREFSALLAAMLGCCLALHYHAAPEQWQRWFPGFVGPRMALGIGITASFVLAGLILTSFREAPAAVPSTPLTEHQRLLAGRGDAYVLEIRNVDLTAQQWGGIGLWRTIQKLADPSRSFLVHENPGRAYPSEIASVSGTTERMFGAVFETTAGLAVEYWPLPVFIAGPKYYPGRGRPANLIVEGRRLARLGVTMFLWQDDEQTTSTQAMIERLFAFFDAHPDVPEALIVVRDGDHARRRGLPPGTGRAREPLGKPNVLIGNAAMLVSRSDRVDALVRPHASSKEGDVNPRDTTSDLSTFWHFYHHFNASGAPDSFVRQYQAAHPNPGYANIPPTMSTVFWHKQLPSFWEERRDRHYIPSPYLPVRWTGGQLKKFDTSPIVGYLHRPVRVALHGEDGKPLPRAQVRANLRKGYDRAVAPLIKGRKPTRLFYDSSHDMQWAVTVMEALKDLPDGGPDPTLESDSYDLHYRIGNLGAVSALGQIALATMAGHDDGRVSITLNTGEADGDHADFIVVTPPEEAEREGNRRHVSSRVLLGGF